MNLITKEELKELLYEIVEDELGDFINPVIDKDINKIYEIIETRLINFEKSLNKLIDDKINNITERIIEQSTTNIINERVDKLLDEKLEKIKKSL